MHAVSGCVDAYADERFDPALDKRTGFRTRSVLAVPIRDQLGRIVGVLQVNSFQFALAP